MGTDATFGTNIDLAGNELRNAKAHVLSAAPATAEGKFYYNSTTKEFLFWNGTAWVAGGAQLGNLSGQAAAMGQAAANGSAATAARSDHYHALPAKSSILLNELGTAAGNYAMGGNKLTGLGAGTVNGDALRYEQVIGQFLSLGGGNLTGNLGLTNVGIDWKNASNNKRWNLRLNWPETGSDNGSKLELYSYNDANVESVSPVIQLDRQTGNLSLNGVLGARNAVQVSGTSCQFWAVGDLYSYTGFVLKNGPAAGPDWFVLDVWDEQGYSEATFKYLLAGNWLFDKPVAMGGNKITGLAAATQNGDAVRYEQVNGVYAPLASPGFSGTPTAPTAAAGNNSTQIATTAYVDAATSAASAGLDVKGSVRAVSTVNIDTANSSQFNSTNCDGVSLAVGDRVLLRAQTNPAENGIYVKNAGTTAATRATDADSSSEVNANMFVFVEEGTSYADTGWVLTTNGPITLGTTGLTFTQFSGPGTYTWGNGLSNSGSTVNVGAGTGISVAADTVAIDTAVVTRKYSATLGTAATSHVITHNLNTQDVNVTVRKLSDQSVVYTSWEATSVNTVTVYFATATGNTHRVTVMG